MINPITLDEARAQGLAIYERRRGTDADDAAAGIGPDDPIRGKWLDCLDAINELTGPAVIQFPDGAKLIIRADSLVLDVPLWPRG